jgi:hypothetical protein
MAIDLSGLTEEQKAALYDEVMMEIAKTDFVTFLRYVYIADDDDPSGRIPFQTWPHLVDTATSWGAGTSEIVLKSRQQGYSWLAAALAEHTSAFTPQALSLLLSMGEEEAQKLKRKVDFIHDNLPPALQTPLKKKRTVTETLYEHGGNIVVLPSTENAGSGYDARLVVVDEAAKHPYAQANYQAYRPTIADGGQLLMISTAKGENFFSRMFWAAHFNESTYKARFVPWMARPGRDDKWYQQEQRNFIGFSDDFNAEFPTTMQDAFAAKSGLVYPMFDERKHVLPVDPFKWQDAKLRVAGVDFGGGDPTAIVALGKSGAGRIHQFDEFYKRGPVGVEELGAWLVSRGPWFRVVCDPSEGTAIASLRAAGLPAVAANNKRSAISLTASFLDQSRLTIAERCKESRKEFIGYAWRDRIDSNSKDHYKTSTPVDHHADAMDARRYALAEIVRLENYGTAVTLDINHKRARYAV